MPGLRRTTSEMEQDDSSSCGSISPLWSSNDSNINAVGADIPIPCEQVQVPVGEPIDELTRFLEETKKQIAWLIQADQPIWEDRSGFIHFVVFFTAF